MKIKILKNYKEVINESYKVLSEHLTKKQDLVLGLATGETMIGLYGKMVDDHKKSGIDYSRIKTFNLDEYYGLQRNHAQSYYHYMNKHLFSKVNINEKNIVFPNTLSNVDASCERYNLALEENKIDVQILGIGSNGHIGFNEPKTSFKSKTRLVELDKTTRVDNSRFFNDLEEVPTHAITMGIENILNAKKIILIASGSDKSKAISKAIDGPVTELVPASILQRHPNVEVMIDIEAGKNLKGSMNYVK
ncbi:glucosamine-6-phosphate deaminase [Mycoplasmatota bacterium zrk1]